MRGDAPAISILLPWGATLPAQTQLAVGGIERGDPFTATAIATPPMLPIPIVAESADARAWKCVISPGAVGSS